jgi:purine-nucleoside phosphorylase
MTASDQNNAGSAAQFVLSNTRLRPKIAVVLGSGLGAFAERLTDTTIIPYEHIPDFPHSTALGHAGNLIVGLGGGTPVVVMQGRVHLYEGYTPQQVAYPIRVLWRMGVEVLVLTNAAGGINFRYRPGELVLIADHINLQNLNPLTGPNDDFYGPRFPDMTEAYSRPYRQLAAEAASELGFSMSEGIYCGWLGPSFETPAEVRYLRTIGADLVGWSTVGEVITARHLRMNVLAIACVTNMAAGMLNQPLTHEEVLETGARVQERFTALLNAVIPRIAKTLT